LNNIGQVYRYIDSHVDEFVEGLKQLLSQPTISTQGVGVRETAELLRSIMHDIGITTQLIETPGAPAIYGEIIEEQGKPTVLIYGHYDVQPPDPLEAWVSPPFQPTVRDGRIYARGAGDNKGQLYAQLMAVKAHLTVNGKLPVNVKFLFEGEEESGSPNLDRCVAENKDRLKCDLVYISDGHLHESGRPLITLGVRGILYVELTMRGARRDLHSGNWGGPAPSAAWRMIELLNTMKDAKTGRILIEGFYDAIRQPTEAERRALRAIPFERKKVAEELGVSESELPEAEEFYEMLMFRPTLNICGMMSGYTGQGMKTVIPSRASVKIDMRLVTDQDPDDIFDKFLKHVKRHAPDVDVVKLGQMHPARTPLENKYTSIVVEAVKDATQKDPIIFPSAGGSLPLSAFTDTLKAPTVMVPYANFDESNHAPNENLKIENFVKGIRCCAALLDKLSKRA